jgi:hypothetical protein
MNYLNRMIVALSIALITYSGITLAAVSELVQIKTRGDVSQPYLLIRESSPVKAVAVLLSGGYGLLKFRTTDSGVAWDEKSNEFLVSNKDRFVDNETAVAVVDTPTDQWNFGYTPKFRKSSEHAEDIRAVVNDLRQRFRGAKVVLIGNSQGSTSASYVGKALGKQVDGVVLTSSVFEWAPSNWRLLYDSNLKDFDFSQIAAPVLVVHHEDDKCLATPFSSAQKIGEKLPLVVIRGGDPVRDNGCGPMGPHGFLGQEPAVVAEIKNWIHGRPHKPEVK